VKETYVKSGFPAEKIFVAYSDIDTEKFDIPKKDRETDDSFKALYVSHTSPLKGLHYLLEAWSQLKIKNRKLTIVGDFKVPEKLRQKYLNIIDKDKTIQWVGYDKDVAKYYKRASIFVFPSLTEGNPKVVMEAMASGLPVITTDNAQSIVKDGESGFVVPIRDSEAIKEKIEFLYNNPDIRETMGRKARRAVENKKNFGEAVYEIYQEICKREGI
jgi:glycosyltransferase involved in cell wall biosynthesis